MRYYHYHGETAYCGTDIDEYLALPNDEELDIEEYEEAMLQQLFDSYSYLATNPIIPTLRKSSRQIVLFILWKSQKNNTMKKWVQNNLRLLTF